MLQFSVVNAAASGAFQGLGPVVAREELGGAAAWGVILALESAGLIVGGICRACTRTTRSGHGS